MEIEARAAVNGTIYRSFPLGDVEFRVGTDGSTDITFEGVASVVDKPYTVRDQWGEFSETIRSGAFTKTLKDSKADVALFVNHRHADVPLATRESGTLRLWADPDLRAVASLDPERPDVQIAKSAVSRRQLGQMSIGFTVPENRDTWNADLTDRTIHEVKLLEVSVVRRGANPYTSASVRSIDELLSISTDDMTEAEVRRAIAHLESLLTSAVPDEQRAAEDQEAAARRFDLLTRLWDQRQVA